MRRTMLCVMMIVVAVTVSACALPRASEIEQARTHVQTIRFKAPKDGLVDAKAKVDIHNVSRVKTKIDEVVATLRHGDVVVAEGRRGGDHSIRPGHTAKLYVEFKGISVADLERTIGGKLADKRVAEFTVDGVIVYESEDGPVRHPFGPYTLTAFLRP